MVLPRRDLADCSGFCGRAMLPSKGLQDPVYQQMDWCVHFELHCEEKKKATIFF